MDGPGARTCPLEHVLLEPEHALQLFPHELPIVGPADGLVGNRGGGALVQRNSGAKLSGKRNQEVGTATRGLPAQQAHHLVIEALEVHVVCQARVKAAELPERLAALAGSGVKVEVTKNTCGNQRPCPAGREDVEQLEVGLLGDVFEVRILGENPLPQSLGVRGMGCTWGWWTRRQHVVASKRGASEGGRVDAHDNQI